MASGGSAKKVTAALEDLALLLELEHLATELLQLAVLLGRQPVLALAAIELVLLEPDPKRLAADAELAGDLTH